MRALILILLLAATPLHAFPVKRCINLGNALEAPREGDWGYTIERQHLSAIAEAGFDTIRLPVRFSAHRNTRIDPAFLARVDEVIGWAREEELRIILDLHHFEELMKAPDTNADAFLDIWQELSEHYRDAPPDLIFELLNEPSGELSTARAIGLYARAMPLIRNHNPDRWVLIGGGNWSDVKELSLLPAYDAHTVHTFHFYKPWDFTHQMADWIEDPPPPRGWGTDQDRRETRRHLQQGLNHKAAPVFLGEFGVYDAAPSADAVEWLAFVRRMAEMESIGWCAWSFSSTFRTYETKEGRWNTDRLDALIPEE
ncbi:glycoside hydrolase family 5 protein [Silicimonas sp. MF1-12-2]|uniref:glycoside hydrolase family 5 protein n=1 Tax=Silicimonas sp. MF1-12-2 TaxID=3384793 RepID=UPI0039B4A22E